MRTNIMAGLMAAALGVGMGFSGTAGASGLGTCGPQNQGQIQSITYYHANGMVSHYWEFYCNGSAWEAWTYLVCDNRGYCINLS